VKGTPAMVAAHSPTTLVQCLRSQQSALYVPRFVEQTGGSRLFPNAKWVSGKTALHGCEFPMGGEVLAVPQGG
jgi:hypothetical protein